MFKVTNERTVKDWPATVRIPADGGKIEEHKIKLDLLLLDTEESNKILQGDEATFKKVVKGWSGIGDATGSEYEYTEANLAMLLKNNFFCAAVFTAYRQAISGQEAAEKN